MDAFALANDVVVDIGASNVEEFINRMNQYRGSHEDFDYFVIPTVKIPKQQRDTISTIETLADMGIPAKKIRVVFNMVDTAEAPERVFSGIFEYAKAEKKFTLRPEAVIHTNELYGKLRASEQKISEILSDPTDLKEQLKTATDAGEKIRIQRQIGYKRLATGVSEELDNIFKILLK